MQTKGRGMEKNRRGRDGEKEKVRKKEKPGCRVSGGKVWGRGVRLQHVNETLANTRERSREVIVSGRRRQAVLLTQSPLWGPVGLSSRTQGNENLLTTQNC